MTKTLENIKKIYLNKFDCFILRDAKVYLIINLPQKNCFEQKQQQCVQSVLFKHISKKMGE